MIHLTPQARSEIRGDEALVFDWHRVAICCACAGEVSLRLATRDRMAVPHLARRDVTIDCRRTLGVRRFRSDLPPDFGLRSVLGRAETS